MRRSDALSACWFIRHCTDATEAEMMAAREGIRTVLGIILSSRMEREIHGAPVVATLRRSPARSNRIGQPADPLDSKCDGEHRIADWDRISGEDPLGLRESRLKTRNVMRMYAMRRKECKPNLSKSGEGQWNLGLVMIRDKMGQMREDLDVRLRAEDPGRKEKIIGESRLVNPPDEGGGPDLNQEDLSKHAEAGNQRTSDCEARVPDAEKMPGCIKD